MNPQDSLPVAGQFAFHEYGLAKRIPEFLPVGTIFHQLKPGRGGAEGSRNTGAGRRHAGSEGTDLGRVCGSVGGWLRWV